MTSAHEAIVSSRFDSDLHSVLEPFTGYAVPCRKLVRPAKVVFLIVTVIVAGWSARAFLGESYESLRWWGGCFVGLALLTWAGNRMSNREEAVKRAEFLARFCSAALDQKPFVLVLRSFTSALRAERIEGR